MRPPRLRTGCAVAVALAAALPAGCTGAPVHRPAQPSTATATVPGGSALPPTGLSARVRISSATQDGQHVWTVSPRAGALPGVVVYLHGGAFTGPLQPLHWRYVTWLTESTLVPVVVPDYPRPPGATVTQTLPFSRRAVERQVAAHPARVTVMGDSSGGGLALSTVQEMARQGRPLPAQVILHSPWLDASLSDPGIPGAQERDPYLRAESLRANGVRYAGRLDVRDPRVSPLYGSMRGLPPVTLHMGDRDLLVVDARRLRDRAAAQAAPIDYREYPGQPHDFMLDARGEQARRVMAQTVRAVRAPAG